MNQTISSARSNIERQFLPVLTGMLLPALALFGLERVKYGLFYLAGLTAFLLLMFPPLCFTLFILSQAAAVHVPIGPIWLGGYDLGGFLLVGSILLWRLLRFDWKFLSTPFDVPIMLFLLAGLISIPFAYKISVTWIPFFHNALILLVFRALVDVLPMIGVRRAIDGFLLFVTAHSILNATLWLAGGGRVRVFGPADVGYEILFMSAMPMMAAFFVWDDRPGKRLLHAVGMLALFLGILATHARGPMLAMLLVLPPVFLLSRATARRLNDRSALLALRKIGLLVAAGAIVLFALGGSTLEEFGFRFQQAIDSFSQPQGTIRLRLLLWSAALQGFASSPLTGIGLGNFRFIEEIVPAVKAESLWLYVKYSSPHNVILQYLAELGIFGAAALLWLGLRGVGTTRKALRHAADSGSRGVSMALYGALLMFLLTLFFMRTWTFEQGGHLLAFLFALAAVWKAEQEKQTDASPTTSEP